MRYLAVDAVFKDDQIRKRTALSDSDLPSIHHGSDTARSIERVVSPAEEGTLRILLLGHIHDVARAVRLTAFSYSFSNSLKRFAGQPVHWRAISLQPQSSDCYSDGVNDCVNIRLQRAEQEFVYFENDTIVDIMTPMGGWYLIAHWEQLDTLPVVDHPTGERKS